jgi:hypothetical protein
MRKKAAQTDILQGTLDMLILQTLAPGPAHGHTIAHAIERRSEEVLLVVAISNRPSQEPSRGAQTSAT